METFKRVILLTVFFFLFTTSALGQLKTLKVGFIPITDYLPVYVAIEKGFFAEQGLKAELVPMAGGAAILPAVAGGSLDLGVAATHSLVLARAQGFDFKVVADGSYIAPKIVALVAHKDAGIRSYKDLEGKKVAINTLKAVGHIFIKEMMERQGGDIKKVHFVEIPFPRMIGPLLNREVDAAHAAEPFVSVMLAEPALMNVGDHFEMVNPGGVLSHIVSTEAWIKKNSDLAARFARSVGKGVDYVYANMAEARQIIPKYTGLEGDVAQKIALTGYKKCLDLKNLQWTVEFMLKHGLIEKSLKSEEMVHETALCR